MAGTGRCRCIEAGRLSTCTSCGAISGSACAYPEGIGVGCLNSPVTAVTAEVFSKGGETSSEPIIGTESENVLPSGALAVVYGAGGTGKTTLVLDVALHLATGSPWLGLDVPRRRRVLWIENEGPRGPFRQKVSAKLTGWQGPELDGHLLIVEEPWSRISLGRDTTRERLATLMEHEQVDVLIAGPVQRLGVEGGGTPAEVAAFLTLVDDLRARLRRSVAVVLIHHENKAGGLSGAWDGVTDLTLHVLAGQHGRTRISWEKARWASTVHRTSWNLAWAEAMGFVLAESTERTDAAIGADILAFIRANPGASWNEVDEGVTGKSARKRAVRVRLEEAGDIRRDRGRNGGMALFASTEAIDADLSPTPGEEQGGRLRPASPHRGDAEGTRSSPATPGPLTAICPEGVR